MCCSGLQCVAVDSSVLQWIAVCCSGLQCVAVDCSVLPRVAQHIILGNRCNCVEGLTGTDRLAHID